MQHNGGTIRIKRNKEIFSSLQLTGNNSKQATTAAA